MGTPEPRTSFVTPASEYSVPSRVKYRDNGVVKNHSEVGVTEYDNANKCVSESGYDISMASLFGDDWNPRLPLAEERWIFQRPYPHTFWGN